MKKYLINEKNYITISIHDYNKNTLIYIDTKGDKILFNLDEKYEKYIIETIYWYALS